MKPIKIYRIENQNTMHGMWYETGGIYNPTIIMGLTEGISKKLPMDYDERYSKDGLSWYSAGKNKENMNLWFSPRDAYELKCLNYLLYEFTVTNYIIEENQILFTRDSIVKQETIPLEELYDFNKKYIIAYDPARQICNY